MTKKVRKRVLREVVSGTYPVIPAKELEQVMKEQVEPYLERVGKAFTVEAADGHRIFGMTFQAEHPRGTVMISHGFTEAWERYMEMIYYFLQDGLSVCIHDHRGHGRSRDMHTEGTGIADTKVTSAMSQTTDMHVQGKTTVCVGKCGKDSNGCKERNAAVNNKIGGPTHIDSFQIYVNDWDEVVKNIMPEMPQPWYLFSHSMGGLIAAMYIQQHPGVYRKAIFNAPMFEVNCGKIPYPVARAAAFLLCLLGKDREFLPGQTSYSDQEDFEGSAVTSRERYLQYYHLQTAHPHLQNGGSSCRWTLEAFRGDAQVLKKERCRKMDLPILLIQADKDDYVNAGGQERFIASVPRGGILFVPGSKHEIYKCDDETMKYYVYAVMRFLR